MNKLSGNAKKTVLVGLALFVLGIFAWWRIMTGGASAIGLSDTAPWGLFIALFLFLEAVGAGGLFFGALRYNKSILAVGVAGVMGAGLAILPDIGTPLVAWRLFLTPNFAAPMVLDVWFVNLNVVLGALLLFALHKQNEGLAKVSRGILLVTSIALPLGTAWMFTTMPGKIGWSSSLETFAFLVASALAGCLLVTLFESGAGKKGVIIALVAAVLLPMAELGNILYGTPQALESLPMHAVLDQYGVLYFSNLILFVALPLVLVCMKIMQPALIAVLAFIGIALTKYLYILQGNILPYVEIGKPSLSGAQTFEGHVMNFYAPTLNEWLVVLGMLSITVSLIVLLVSFCGDRAAAA
jgi:dimethyl sulfoxide reductase membrane subunit